MLPIQTATDVIRHPKERSTRLHRRAEASSGLRFSLSHEDRAEEPPDDAPDEGRDRRRRHRFAPDPERALDMEV